MDKFYTTGLHTITAVTDKDLTGATTVEMHYKKPSGIIGAWSATLEDGYKVVYNTSDGNINEAGKWEFYPDVTAGGKRYVGEVFSILFYNPGE